MPGRKHDHSERPGAFLANPHVPARTRKPSCQPPADYRKKLTGATKWSCRTSLRLATTLFVKHSDAAYRLSLGR